MRNVTFVPCTWCERSWRSVCEIPRRCASVNISIWVFEVMILCTNNYRMSIILIKNYLISMAVGSNAFREGKIGSMERENKFLLIFNNLLIVNNWGNENDEREEQLWILRKVNFITSWRRDWNERITTEYRVISCIVYQRRGWIEMKCGIE